MNENSLNIYRSCRYHILNILKNYKLVFNQLTVLYIVFCEAVKKTMKMNVQEMKIMIR